MKPSKWSRRRFMQGPAATAAVTAMPAFLSAQSPNDQIRVGIIGAGGRGTSLLRRIVRSPGVKLVAVCDIDPSARERAAKVASDANQEHGTAHAPEMFTDYRKLLDRKDIDAVVVATPVDLHKEMAMAALEVHKHLYLEKPMGKSVEEVNAVYHASKSSRGKLQLGFQLRFDPYRRASIEHIRQGGIGHIAYLQANRHTPDLPRHKLWYFDASVSGNCIIEQAVHIIDLMNWAADGHPLQAYGAGGINVYKNQPPGRTTYDHYTVIYDYPNDIRLTYTHVFIDPRGFTGISEKAWGSEYAIDFPTATLHRLYPQGRRASEVKTLEVEDPDRDSTESAVNSFFDAVRADREPVNNAAWGRLAALTAIMATRSIEEKRIVKWSELEA